MSQLETERSDAPNGIDRPTDLDERVDGAPTAPATVPTGSAEELPVFVDGTGSRKRSLMFVAVVSAVLVSLVAVLFILSVAGATPSFIPGVIRDPIDKTTGNATSKPSSTNDTKKKAVTPTTVSIPAATPPAGGAVSPQTPADAKGASTPDPTTTTTSAVSVAPNASTDSGANKPASTDQTGEAPSSTATDSGSPNPPASGTNTNPPTDSSGDNTTTAKDPVTSTGSAPVVDPPASTTSDSPPTTA